MALPTIAEIDAAVPAAGTPNRALTNAVLKGMLPSTYLGQCATHGKYPMAKLTSTNNQIMSRIQHQATENLLGKQLRFVNYYTTNGTANGAAASVTCTLEYPIGTFNRVKFSGSNTGNMIDGGDVLSDPLDFDIPSGAIFREWCWRTSTSQALYCNTARLVDKANYGPSITDVTGTGVLTGMFDSELVYGFTECIGQTSKPTYLILGDSRAAGAGDLTGYGTNATGCAERALTQAGIAYINIAVSGTSVWMYHYNSPAKIKDFANRVSGIIILGGINDLRSGNNAATCKTNFELVIGSYNPSGRKQVYVGTIEPYTTSTDAWATEANQTIWDATYNAQRVIFNTTIRKGGLVGQWGCFDQAAGVESVANPGKWLAPGYTDDGLHGTTLSAIKEQAALPQAFGATAYIY